jgi:hypothetical protein
MPFQKGNPRPAGAGRKKGGPQRLQGIRRDVADKLAELNYDPIIRMVEVAEKTESEAIRSKIAMELAKYVHPQLRSMELVGTGGGPVEVNVSGVDLLKSRIDSIVQRKRTGSNIPGAD